MSALPSSNFSQNINIICYDFLSYETLSPRTLYWTDTNTNRPAIYRSSVVKPARETLVTGNLRWPNALAIDFTGNCIHGS